MLDILLSPTLRVSGLGIWVALLLSVAVWLWRRRSPRVSPRLLRHEATELSWLLIGCVGVFLGLVPGADRVMASMDAAMGESMAWTDPLVALRILPAGWLAVLSICLAWLLREEAGGALGVEGRGPADDPWSRSTTGLGARLLVLAAQVAAVVLLCYVAPAAEWQAAGRPLTVRERERGSGLPSQGIYLTNGTPLRERDGPSSNMRAVARPAVSLHSKDHEPVAAHAFADALLHPQQHWDVPVPDRASIEIRYFELTDARALRGRELSVDIPTFGEGPWLVEIQFIAEEPRVIAYGGELHTNAGGTSERAHRVLPTQTPRDTRETYDPNGPGLP